MVTIRENDHVIACLIKRHLRSIQRSRRYRNSYQSLGDVGKLFRSTKIETFFLSPKFCDWEASVKGQFIVTEYAQTRTAKLGHRTLQMTSRYTHAMPQNLRNAVDSLNKRPLPFRPRSAPRSRHSVPGRMGTDRMMMMTPCKSLKEMAEGTGLALA